MDVLLCNVNVPSGKVHSVQHVTVIREPLCLYVIIIHFAEYNITYNMCTRKGMHVLTYFVEQGDAVLNYTVNILYFL